MLRNDKKAILFTIHCCTLIINNIYNRSFAENHFIECVNDLHQRSRYRPSREKMRTCLLLLYYSLVRPFRRCRHVFFFFLVRSLALVRKTFCFQFRATIAIIRHIFHDRSLASPPAQTLRGRLVENRDQRYAVPPRTAIFRIGVVLPPTHKFLVHSF